MFYPCSIRGEITGCTLLRPFCTLLRLLLHVISPYPYFGLFLLLIAVYSLVVFFLFFLDPKKNKNKEEITLLQQLTTRPTARGKFTGGRNNVQNFGLSFIES